MLVYLSFLIVKALRPFESMVFQFQHATKMPQRHTFLDIITIAFPLRFPKYIIIKQAIIRFHFSATLQN